MDEKYLEYNVEDLLQDRDFVSMVLRSSENEAWDGFVSRFPEFKKKLKTARKIIRLLEDAHDYLPEGDLYALWLTIGRFEAQRARHGIRKLKRTIRYAAVVLLIAAISGLSVWHFSNFRKNNSFFETHPDTQMSQSRLILSNGNEIGLKKDYSTVVFGKDGVKINNESVISVKNPGRKKLNEMVVSFGRQSRLQLEDGTKIWLNADSRLAFPTRFGGASRTVYLEGEAYFEVAHREREKFLVNVNDVEISVLGTRFNVSAYPDAGTVETVLLEGSVAIEDLNSSGFLKKGDSFIVSPGQMAVYDRGRKTVIVTDVQDGKIYAEWINGWFSFFRRTLTEVLERLQRFYNVKFEYATDFASDEQITGKLYLTILQ